MATFVVGDRVRIQGSGKYGGRIGVVEQHELYIERAGGYGYTVRFEDGHTGAFKAQNLQSVEEGV